MNERKTINRVGLIGAGRVGASFAHSLKQRGAANELVLIDMDTARAEGKMMDLISSACATSRRACSVSKLPRRNSWQRKGRRRPTIPTGT